MDLELDQIRTESAKNVAEARVIFARREQRLREWDDEITSRAAALAFVG